MHDAPGSQTLVGVLSWFRKKHKREPTDAELAHWEATYRSAADAIVAYRTLVRESLADYDRSLKHRRRKTG